MTDDVAVVPGERQIAGLVRGDKPDEEMPLLILYDAVERAVDLPDHFAFGVRCHLAVEEVRAPGGPRPGDLRHWRVVGPSGR